MPEQAPVLVVGAGPAGLTAAAELSRRGVPVRVVDKADAPSPLTKALMVWPRTLEVLRQLGGAEHLSAYGLPIDSFRYYSEARQICRIPFDARTQPSVVTQPDVEALLRASLEAAGGRVEWGTLLTGLEQDPDSVRATLRTADGGERTESFSYAIGADGAGSTVRKLLGLEFQGSTYPNVFILADTSVEGELQRDAVHYYQSSRGILVMVPLYNGRFRIFTAAPPTLRQEDLSDQVLQEYVDSRGPGGLRLHDVDWRTTFNIHARHTDRFGVGRVFVAGDAAHIHSPAGGQGLNTGVTDAHNLAWKLALVHAGRAVPELLDSYQDERTVVAAGVVRQAELQTRAWLLKKRWQVLLRDFSARQAQWSGLFDRYYSPWLAGLTNRYPAGPAVAGSQQRRGTFVNGCLVPELPVRAAGQPGTVRLRDVLPDDRYTLLLTGPAGASRPRSAAAEALLAEYPELLALRTVGPGGALVPAPGHDRWSRRATAVLVRPDHHVAAQDRGEDLGELRAHLAGVLTPAATVERHRSAASSTV
jgi:2-polyprenyl-6-methoxyphenol hydroxylase-like FAD-dependent oxidoreductase